MARPVIGVTLDSEEAGGYASFPWYALRENYCEAVVLAGGLPMALSHHPDLAEDYLSQIDGLIVTGGNFDVDPEIYGNASRHESVRTKDRRTAFEFSITKAALQYDMPVFGICGGQQLLNVILGGTLIQHIDDEVTDALPHEQPNPRNEAGHSIKITPDTMLHRITDVGVLNVNSAHHQAVKTVGGGTLINAVAEDGVIEGIEAPRYRFCLGLQWHPEFHISDADRKIFEAFVSECSHGKEQ